MKQRPLTLAETFLIAATRGMLGGGLGLLLSDRFHPQTRKAVGWTLLLTGVVTTIPLLALVLGKPTLPQAPSVTDQRRRERRRSHLAHQ